MSWDTVSLGEVTEIISGTTPSTSEPKYWDGTIPWVTPAELSEKNTIVDRTARMVTKEAVAKTNLRLMPAGTVLLSSRAPIGKVAITAIEMCCNQGFKNFVCSEELNNKYLYHYLKSKVAYLQSLGRGATFKEINKATVERIQIPLPPLDVQKKIAAVLDRADRLRQKRKEAIARLDDLVQSVFLDMFGDPVDNPKGWEMSRFGELLFSISSGKSPICEDRPAYSNEWGVLKLSAVTSGKYLQQENKGLQMVTTDGNVEVKQGDVLFTRKNTHSLVAACAYVYETIPRRLLPDTIFRFEIKDKEALYPLYLTGLLSEPKFRGHVQALASGSAGSMPNISKAKLLEFNIPVPEPSLQKKYEGIAMQVYKVKLKLDEELSELNNLFNSLLQRAFKGSLTFNDKAFKDLENLK